MSPELFCESVCRKASEMGAGLRLEPSSHGYTWAWAIRGMVVCSGGTTAETKPVALFFACEDMENVIPNVR